MNTLAETGIALLYSYTLDPDTIASLWINAGFMISQEQVRLYL
jgi:hypothetical protein